MRSEADQPRSLRDIELEVEAEGREWMADQTRDFIGCFA